MDLALLCLMVVFMLLYVVINILDFIYNKNKYDSMFVSSFNEFLNESNRGLPIIKIKKVYHVGDMDIKDKSKFSLEGSGLSVSLHPDEWRKIARLGARDLYLLSNSGGLFVDGNKLDSREKSDIISWGLESGYIDQKETYKVCWYDDELDQEVCMEFDTLDAAELEAGSDREISINKGGILPTLKLNSESMQDRIEPSQTFDLLLTIFVDRMTNFDGIWWDDYLDVSKYSAPRGVIFNSKINRWSISRI